jgi:hypothetical protein
VVVVEGIEDEVVEDVGDGDDKASKFAHRSCNAQRHSWLTSSFTATFSGRTASEP